MAQHSEQGRLEAWIQSSPGKKPIGTVKSLWTSTINQNTSPGGEGYRTALLRFDNDLGQIYADSMKFPHPLSRRAFVILVLISCISCSSNRATKLSQPGVVGESEIVGVAQTWIARYNAGDVAGVARLYEENGYYASAHILAHGREAIERYWARGIAAGRHIDFIRPVEVRVEGDFGYLLGKYQATNAGKTVDGRIIIIAKRDKGGWMIAVHETVVRDQPE